MTSDDWSGRPFRHAVDHTQDFEIENAVPVFAPWSIER